MSAFDRLSPSLQHHIVNDLGWRSLRPLQEEAAAPLLAGEHALLLAPTAGGKTEAAFFPLLTRMLAEEWRGLSVLYVCPIRALLNDLEHRLSRYASWAGRRVALWHGDVPAAAKRRLVGHPPDVLLTTPESLEVILVTRRADSHAFFAAVRAVVVDELHAFAGDDRGWHLLSLLERIARLARREVQRVGLSATIGNPGELLAWLRASSVGPGRVIAPAGGGAREVAVGLDHVGSVGNAAEVISRLHRGEKRLVFCDSRARVEELAVELRKRRVETFVSHSSLGAEERRRAEEAFAGARGSVIVATSTLELGIDVGDLDRVIQVDAPATVASFLQRLGRSGRRPGTTANCLFLATSDDALLQAAGLLRLWSAGHVEPVEPPLDPFHILGQQVMAVALQEGGVGRARLGEWLGGVPAFRAMDHADFAAVVDHMLATGILFDDEGVLWLGERGEAEYGFRNFMELFSVFVSPPLFRVLHGRREIGEVHPISFQAPEGETAQILLAGRSWALKHVDWLAHVAFVQPSDTGGRARWLGTARPLHFRLCRAMREVLAGEEPPGDLSERCRRALADLRSEFHWVGDGCTAVVRRPTGRARWYTFAGLFANAALAAGVDGEPENLSIALPAAIEPRDLERLVREVAAAGRARVVPRLVDRAIDELKFSSCVPRRLAERTLLARMSDPEALLQVARCPVRAIVDPRT